MIVLQRLDADMPNVVFDNREQVKEAGGTIRDLETVFMPQQLFEDMDRPEIITVTVEPGNTIEGST